MKNETILNVGETKRVVRERKYKAGYVVRDEYKPTHFEDKPKGHAFLSTSAYNLNGDYIGSSKYAYRLIVNNGILPEKAEQSDNICTVGFCKKENKWYGWSHRALCGFGIGDMLFNEHWAPEGGTGERDNCGFLVECEKIPFRLRGAVKIEDLEQAKHAAINFADYVG